MFSPFRFFSPLSDDNPRLPRRKVGAIRRRILKISGVPTSMGPRRFSRGMLVPEILSQPLKMRLQWGHGVSAVECYAGPGHRYLDQLASMGPRRFSRGMWCNWRPGRAGICRFNGATAFQPWNGWDRKTTSHCCRRFNGATAFQPWNARSSLP